MGISAEVAFPVTILYDLTKLLKAPNSDLIMGHEKSVVQTVAILEAKLGRAGQSGATLCF